MNNDIVHGRLSASRCTQYLNCPASPAMSERHSSAEEADPFRDQGTLAHKVASDLLIDGFSGVEDHPEIQKFESDEIASLKVYLEFCRQVIHHPDTVRVLIEKDLGSSISPDVRGIVDFAAFTPSLGGRSVIWVVDYKHGAGERVSAYLNDQLLQYAVLISDQWTVWADEYRLVIVQPRYFGLADDEGVDQWVVPGEVIKAHRDKIVSAVVEVERKDLIEITTGLEAEDTNPGDHCRWCSARGYCPGLYKATVVALSGTATPDIVFAPPAELRPEHLSYVLNMEDQIKAWLKQVRSFVTAEVMAGSPDYPDYKLVESQGNRRYKDIVEAESALEICFGEEAFERKLKSPAQIEKMIKTSDKVTTKTGKAILSDLTERPTSGVSLVRVESQKEALEFPSAAQEFGAIE